LEWCRHPSPLFPNPRGGWWFRASAQRGFFFSAWREAGHILAQFRMMSITNAINLVFSMASSNVIILAVISYHYFTKRTRHIQY
jgi:hypothetical protein